ncbi:LssY C-terminal domain-containing protein [Aureliella helgolandensis]|uniref:LssY C-terminal domain-containing protein n=1 Tax=Aureliella helgolandensis TaxID=2527968 RepID=UPI003704468E
MIAPILWKTFARHDPSFDESLRITRTRDGHPGDALNVGFIGTESQRTNLMKNASWFPASALVPVLHFGELILARKRRPATIEIEPLGFQFHGSSEFGGCVHGTSEAKCPWMQASASYLNS